MYREKLINHIDNSPAISFIIKSNGDFVCVEFIKENDNYYFLSTDVKDENNKLIKVGTPHKESLNILNEANCKMFVEKIESMIMKEYINK